MAGILTIAGRLIAVAAPIALGISVLVMAAGSKPGPERTEAAEIGRKVRVIEVPKLDLVPRVNGFGTVKPEHSWNAVAEVPGRIIEVHPLLRDGSIIAKSEVLIKIDPAAFKLALAELQAQLAQKEIENENGKASLAIEERNLALVEADLERKKNLAARGTTAQSNVDAAERTVLASRQAVQNERSKLALIPAQINVLEAQIASARLDLDNTVIRAPFDIRVREVAVELAQFVSTGQTLFVGDSINRVEITVPLSIDRLASLFPQDPDFVIDPLKSSKELPERAGFRPVVRLDIGNNSIEWPGEFLRIAGALDQKTRTVGVVIAVDRPYEDIKGGARPPLVNGMFVEVEISGKAQPGRIVVPRTALHGAAVYLVDDENRLDIRSVRTGPHTNGIVPVVDGLAGGETLVVSDLIPAVDGMLLNPVTDEDAQSALAAEAGAGQ